MNLKAARLQAGLTQKQLAKELEIHPLTVSGIENGRKRPSPELALKIEKALSGSITHSELLYPDLQHTKKTKINTIINKLRKLFSAVYAVFHKF